MRRFDCGAMIRRKTAGEITARKGSCERRVGEEISNGGGKLESGDSGGFLKPRLINSAFSCPRLLLFCYLLRRMIGAH